MKFPDSPVNPIGRAKLRLGLREDGLIQDRISPSTCQLDILELRGHRGTGDAVQERVGQHDGHVLPLGGWQQALVPDFGLVDEGQDGQVRELGAQVRDILVRGRHRQEEQLMPLERGVRGTAHPGELPAELMEPG